MTAFRPEDAKQVAEIVTWAAAEEQPLELIGGGSKRGIGRAVQAEHALHVSGIAGIIEYEPSELVLTAKAGTPIAAIEAALAQHRQMMAFEPPDWRSLLGTETATPTIGGVLSCNLAGPRRLKAGAARDHFLGFQSVSGRGELYKAGGKVVKNVTGYDLCKLLAGAYGTLGVLTEVTIKVGPRPETACTILVLGLDDADALRALTAGLNSAHEVSGAAHLPARLPHRSAVTEVASTKGAVTALRIEGPEPSVAFRADALRGILGPIGPTAALDSDATAAFWQEIRDATLLLAEPRAHAVWRVSATPSSAPAIASAILTQTEAAYYFDWGGGLIWVAVGDCPDGGAEAVGTALGTHGGGHATLMRAPESIRAAVPVFEPLAAPLAALSARVKAGFDPQRILNPGRMYAGV